MKTRCKSLIVIVTSIDDNNTHNNNDSNSNTSNTTNHNHDSNHTVSFHNFKSQNFKLSVSNPKSKYVAYLSVLPRISNCQGLGRKNRHDILKTDLHARREPLTELIFYLIWGHRTIIIKHHILKHHIPELPNNSSTNSSNNRL